MTESYRTVPRNIDQPNRMVEYVFAFLIPYYATMFLMHRPLISFTLGFICVYLMYKIMLDKPEGAAFRVLYRIRSIGKMLPNPRKAPKFEV